MKLILLVNVFALFIQNPCFTGGYNTSADVSVIF